MVVVMQKGTRMKCFIQKKGESAAVWLFGNALSTQLASLFKRNPSSHRWFFTESYCSGWTILTSACAVRSKYPHKCMCCQIKLSWLKLQRASASAAAHDADAAQVALTGHPCWLVQVSVDKKMVQTYMVVVMQKARRMKSLSCAWLRCRSTGRARLGKPRPQQTGWTHCSREGFQPWDVTTLHDFSAILHQPWE